jgi:hypothetical protein
MIELLDRKKLLSLNQTFAAFILNIQDAKYNPMHNRYEPGIMYVEDDEKARYVSKDECDKWNREEQVGFDQIRDKIQVKPQKFIDELVFKLPHSEINQYLENLSDALENLNKKLEWQSILFLLEYPTPWLWQANDFEPVKKAIDYLQNLGATNDFKGGFIANGQDLKNLIKQLFWLIRCNASLPDCYFSGLEKEFVGHICKYGNIHFYFYSEADRNEIHLEAQKVGLYSIETNHCFDSFDISDKIEGRTIIV